MPTGEKLQKILAQAGYGSRREMERWIAEGRITINGRIAEIGDRVKQNTPIKVDNKPFCWPEAGSSTPRILLYHKPEGEICSRNDPEGRPTVFDNLPPIKNGRWVSIGRLDINTSGLLLFTDDGNLANRLMHPSYQVEREYAVRVLGTASKEVLHRLTHGVQLEDGTARFEHIVESGGKGVNRWYHVVMVAGRNRLVRRLWESQNLKVSRLIRVRYGDISLPSSLPQGRWQELTGKIAVPFQDKF